MNEIEQLITDKGANVAPRVTPADIEAEIVCETYFTADQGAIHAGEPYHDALTLLTFCVLVLHNGFTVTGESACASPENFNAEVGRKVARANAVSKCWALLGFRLRDELQEMAERAVREREALKMVRGEDAFGAPEDAA